MANLVVKTIVKVKKTLIKAIMNTKANIFIITLPIIKKLRMTTRMPNKNRIIAIDQIKKNIISIVKDIPF